MGINEKPEAVYKKYHATYYTVAGWICLFLSLIAFVLAGISIYQLFVGADMILAVIVCLSAFCLALASCFRLRAVAKNIDDYYAECPSTNFTSQVQDKQP